MKERILIIKTRHGIEKIPESIVLRHGLHLKKENQFLGDTEGNKTPPQNREEVGYDGRYNYEKIYLGRAGERMSREEFNRRNRKV